jgi:hypothetical protein
MNSSPFFLGFAGTFKLINFDKGGATNLSNVVQVLLVLIDFFTLKYTYDFIEDKNNVAFQIWFYLYLTLIVLYKPIRFRIFDSSNNAEQYFVIGYLIAYVITVILSFVVVFVPYPSPPAELIIAILGGILSLVITFTFIYMEKENGDQANQP